MSTKAGAAADTTTPHRFSSRSQAGELLAQKLPEIVDPQAVVLGIPRGGVVVARAIADTHKLPLDVVIVKKLGAPINPELAIGALAPDGVGHIDWKFANLVGADEAYLKREQARTQQEIKRREKVLRNKRKPLKMRDKTVILVDDGAATGSTLEAAVKWARTKKARRIIAVLPVAAEDTVAKIKPEVDELVVLLVPETFRAVGQFYDEFKQVSDEEVVSILMNTL